MFGTGDVIINVGVKAIKVTDSKGSIVVYYAESGIETSDVSIGNISKAIYLDTDFGEQKYPFPKKRSPFIIYDDLFQDAFTAHKTESQSNRITRLIQNKFRYPLIGR